MRKFEEIKKEYEKLNEYQEELIEIEYSNYEKKLKKLQKDESGEFAYNQCKDYIPIVLNMRNLSITNLYSMIKTEKGQLKLADSLRAWTEFGDPTNCDTNKFEIESFCAYLSDIANYLEIEATLSAYMSNDPNYEKTPKKLRGFGGFGNNTHDNHLIITAENIAKADGFTFNGSANREK